MGLWELIAFLMFGAWSVVMTVMSLVGGGMVWTMVDERMKGAATEGKLGEAFDFIQAVKFFTLCLVVGLTSIIGGYSLGEVASELIAWFDAKSMTMAVEGTDKKTGDLDERGTSAMYDIIYHYATLFMGQMLFTVIGFGGMVFGFMYMGYTEL